MTRRLVVSLAALAAVPGLLRLAEPGRDSLISEAAAAAGRRLEDARDTAVVAHGQADCVAGLREAFAGSREAAPGEAPRSLRCEVEGDEVRIVDESGAAVGGASLPRWTSLLPPLAAVILALGTRLLLPSLLAGVWLGAFLIDPGWDLGLVRLLLGTFWPVVSDQFNLSILLFTFALVGMVNVA
ncbi:MAG: hypothetical protein QME96_16025, partial [Myxococcota bacterium]|nr:hypothetical protein [Myxococcota bacterium]